MKNLIPTIIIALAIISCSCDSTEPPIVENPTGRRDYVWSVDSISRPGFPYIKSMWGSSPTDVWGAGFSEDVRDCLWHYDGVSWKRAAEGTPITTSGNGSPIIGGVLGISKNNVWAFGGRRFSNPESSEPFVMQFNGSKWYEIIGDINNMAEGFIDYYLIRNQHFWISSAHNVYEYKMGTWKEYFIGENYIMQSIEGTGNSIYITAYPVGVDSLYLMKFDGNKFVPIDDTNLFGAGKFGNFGMVFNNKKVFTFDYDAAYVAEVNNDQIVPGTWQILKEPQIDKVVNTIKIAENNIWAVGGSPFPYHYNGTDWKEIDIYSGSERPVDNQFWGIWSNEDEIFIYDINNGISYHGK